MKCVHVTVGIVRMEDNFSTRFQINRQKIMKRHRNLKFEANLDYTVRLVTKPGGGKWTSTLQLQREWISHSTGLTKHVHNTN